MCVDYYIQNDNIIVKQNTNYQVHYIETYTSFGKKIGYIKFTLKQEIVNILWIQVDNSVFFRQCHATRMLHFLAKNYPTYSIQAQLDISDKNTFLECVKLFETLGFIYKEEEEKYVISRASLLKNTNTKIKNYDKKLRLKLCVYIGLLVSFLIFTSFSWH